MYSQSSGEKRSCENDRNKAAIRNYGAEKKYRQTRNIFTQHSLQVGPVSLLPAHHTYLAVWQCCEDGKLIGRNKNIKEQNGLIKWKKSVEENQRTRELFHFSFDCAYVVVASAPASVRCHCSCAGILIQFSAQPDAHTSNFYSRQFILSICLFNLTWNSLTVIYLVGFVQTMTGEWRRWPLLYASTHAVMHNTDTFDIMKTESYRLEWTLLRGRAVMFMRSGNVFLG